MYSLLPIIVVEEEAKMGAGFITNQFYIQNIREKTKSI
jgi:hypothetical protein